MSDLEEMFIVVNNEEEQYSVWRASMPIPNGWYQIGEIRKLQECLDFIDENWTDLRPKSLRLAMEN